MTTGHPEFRRTDQDRQPPRRVVTGLLLGDPPADLAERRRDAETREPTTPSRAFRRSITRIIP